MFSSRVLPQVFWTLHTSANLSALGKKARPLACGDVAENYWRCFLPPIRQEAGRLLPILGPVRRSNLRWGRDNGAHSNTGFEEGCTILSYDGANAFNHIYRHRFLPALAEIILLVVPYASNMYAREPPKLLFALDGGGLEVVESA